MYDGKKQDTKKFLLKNFTLVEETDNDGNNGKMYILYNIDNEGKKQFRIFFKDVLLKNETREFIRKAFTTGESLDELLDRLWIVKSKKGGVLLFVPEETEKSDKSGTFVLIIGKSYFYPNPMYYKRHYNSDNKMSNKAASIFYLLPKSPIYLHDDNNIKVIVESDQKILCIEYSKVNSMEI